VRAQEAESERRKKKKEGKRGGKRGKGRNAARVAGGSAIVERKGRETWSQRGLALA